MFVAWPLYVLHSVLTGTSLAVANALGIHDGFGFSAIVDTIARVVDRHRDGDPEQVCRAGTGIETPELDVERVLRADRWARQEARRVLGLGEGKPA